MLNTLSQSLIVYRPPSNFPSFETLKDHIIQRTGSCFEQAVSLVSNILKDYPNFAPFAFDIATHMEKEGGTQSANKMRRVAANTICKSPQKISNPNFLTPPLTGKYPVGMKGFFLEDTSRNEKDLGHSVDRTRRIEMEVYYPAVHNENPQYKAFVIFNDSGKIENLWTRSQPNATPSLEEKFPIIVFSHGLNNNHDDYLHIIEELASHGFCVVTVNHPFTNFMSYFNGNSPDTRLYPKGIENDRAPQERMTNSRDVQFVIQQIREGQIEGFHDFFGGSINKDFIGVFGHSLGGGASLHTCRALPYVRCGINIDGTSDPDFSGKETVTQPFLTIIAGHSDLQERGWIDGHPTYPQHALASEFRMEDAEHNDFSAHAYYTAQEESSEPSKQAMEVYQQTNRLVIDFFSKHLKGWGLLSF